MSHFVVVMSLFLKSFYMISFVYHRLCSLINRTIFNQMNHSLCLRAIIHEIGCLGKWDFSFSFTLTISLENVRYILSDGYFVIH